MRARLGLLALALFCWAAPGMARAAEPAHATPVRIGLDAEFGHRTSTSVIQTFTLTGNDGPRARDALDRVGPHDGLARRYQRHFTPDRHEALSPERILVGRFLPDGSVARE